MTLDEQLNSYKTDPDAAKQEVLRAKQVYADKMAAGDKAGAEAAHNWANQVRAAAGLSDSEYGSGVNLQTAQNNYSKPATPVATSKDPGGLTTGVKSAYDYYGPAVNTWTNPNQNKVDTLVNDILSSNGFDYKTYDPNKDAAFVQYRDKNISLGNAAYNNNVAAMSTPGLQDSSIGRQVAEAGRSEYMNRIQDAIPEFMDRARDDYNNALNNKYKNFDMLNTLSSDDYSHWKDKENANTNKWNSYVAATGYMPVDTSQIAADDPLRKIPDYQAEINKRKKVNPNDPLIPVLVALRYEKIMNDPELMKQYGSTAQFTKGLATQDTVQQAYDNALNKDSLNETKKMNEWSITDAKADNARADRELTANIANMQADNARADTAGSSGGSVNSKTASNNYAEATYNIQNAKNSDEFDSLYQELISDPEAVKAQVGGSSNYYKLINTLRTSYVNYIKRFMASSPAQELLNTFNGNPKYKEILGDAAFTALVNWAKTKDKSSSDDMAKLDGLLG
jgi:hypothetical protein